MLLRRGAIDKWLWGTSRRTFASTPPPSVAEVVRGLPVGTRPSAAYAALVARGALRADEHQRAALPLLDTLYADIAASAASLQAVGSESPTPAPRRGLWSLFGGGSPQPPPPPLRSAPRGLYMWGGTGCGKTLLMDLLAETARTLPGARVKRVHYHDFMLTLHAGLHAARGAGGGEGALGAVARSLLGEAEVLCFDEVQVTEVGDAMLLRRLFDGLFSGGTPFTLVATSNRAPRGLYAGGLAREHFLPFISLLEARCTVHELASPTDHRLLSAPRGCGWISPAGSSRDRKSVV